MTGEILNDDIMMDDTTFNDEGHMDNDIDINGSYIMLCNLIGIPICNSIRPVGDSSRKWQLLSI